MVTRFLFHGAPIIERKTRSNIVSPLLFSLHFEDDINSKFGRAIRYDKIRRCRFAHSFSILDQKPDRNANESTRTMERTTDVLSPSTSHPNPRHVVYFIALLALLHQFPSVYTSPAVVTALSLPSLLPSP